LKGVWTATQTTDTQKALEFRSKYDDDTRHESDTSAQAAQCYYMSG